MAPRIGAGSSQCAGGNVLRDFGPRGGSRSISTVANQSHRSGHTQPKCVYYFQNACEAGTLVLGCLVALPLLLLAPKAAGEPLLRHSPPLCVRGSELWANPRRLQEALLC